LAFMVTHLLLGSFSVLVRYITKKCRKSGVRRGQESGVASTS
jgi:hypothetical protein